jgi:hypothetical protein
MVRTWVDFRPRAGSNVKAGFAKKEERNTAKQRPIGNARQGSAMGSLIDGET